MRFLKANKLFDGKNYLPDSSVLALDSQNTLKEIIADSNVQKDKIEFFEGIITPGFVNTHCHLELSHLKNTIQKHSGIPEFGKQIIKQRTAGFTKTEINLQAFEADKAMWEKGIVAVGDISNGVDSLDTKQNSKIYYHTFVEILGLNPANQTIMFDYGLTILNQFHSYNLAGSITPHAPYSTSLDLIKSIAKYNKEHHLPLSIHNQETEEETKFFMGEASGFKNLYDFLNLDISWFKAPLKSSLAYYIDTINDQKTILVHNTFSDKNDVQLAIDKGCFFCFCPKANLYIENKLPNFSLFTEAMNALCIGTDSLASNDALDIVSEANIILKRSGFGLENILQMLTYNGAAALDITEKFGSFLIGKNAGLNLVDFKNDQLTFLKKLT